MKKVLKVKATFLEWMENGGSWNWRLLKTVPQKSVTNYRFHQRFRAIVKRIKNYAFSTKNELAKTLLWAKYSAFLSDMKKNAWVC